MARLNDLRRAVRRHYAERAKAIAEKNSIGCCDAAAPVERLSGDAYTSDELDSLPPLAVAGSMGSGNPVARAQLRPGETVVDLGCGAGLDAILAARAVGRDGRVIGVDMTDGMLELARVNAREAGADNVEFRKGGIEALPLPTAFVDVVISNCVVNLAPDKHRVLEEAFRVLRPGGRAVIADLVARGQIPEAIRQRAEMWAACVAGALSQEEYEEALSAAGFAGIEVEVLREFTVDDAEALGAAELLGELGEDEREGLGVASVVLRARKP